MKIRNLIEDDLLAFVELQTDPVVMRYVGGPQSSEEAISDFRSCTEANQNSADDLWFIWAAESKETDRFIGTVACVQGRDRNEIEIGFRLLPASWNQGIASELTPYLLQYALSELRAKQVMASVDADNEASVKVLDKWMNFVELVPNHEEGCLDRIYLYEG
ncbi:MAG: GNAT family N-acetyltransferase [Saprospiraceae bacterium]|nr:GNAT family N-acetyltransferase [Saprospiraceae bacterium]